MDVALLPMGRTPFNESRLPVKLTEYLAANLPVLLGDVGETGILGRELKGAVILPGERQGWVDNGRKVIQELLENPRPIVPIFNN